MLDLTNDPWTIDKNQAQWQGEVGSPVKYSYKHTLLSYVTQH